MSKDELKTCPSCEGGGFDSFLGVTDHMTPCERCGGMGSVFDGRDNDGE